MRWGGCPGGQRLLGRLGRTYLQLKSPERAAKRFARALELNPKLTMAYEPLAKAQALLGNTDDAIRYYEEVLRREPSNTTMRRVKYELRALRKAQKK